MDISAFGFGSDNERNLAELRELIVNPQELRRIFDSIFDEEA